MAKKKKAPAKKRAVALTRADGKWTEAKYQGFIRSQLRKGWMKWPVKNAILAEARVERGVYRCSCCQELVTASISILGANGKQKKVKGINVDHIVPATPLNGEYDWDIFAHNLYCERDNLWAICHHCHNHKTQKVEKPLAALLSLKQGYPVRVGRYVLVGGETKLLEPNKCLFSAIYDPFEQYLEEIPKKGTETLVSISLWELLSSNGGIKKGEGDS